MRYQYGVMLIGIFCTGLLFLPKLDNTEIMNSDFDRSED